MKTQPSQPLLAAQFALLICIVGLLVIVIAFELGKGSYRAGY